MAEELLQIIYASASATKMDADELNEILRAARENNAAADISGMLVYHAGSFLQVLEGPADAVSALFEKIERDPRHGRIDVLFRDTIPAKEFEDWSMGYVDASGEAGAYEGYVDYLRDLERMTLDGTRGRRILKMFQEGRWRQSVDR